MLCSKNQQQQQAIALSYLTVLNFYSSLLSYVVFFGFVVHKQNPLSAKGKHRKAVW